MIRSSTAVTGHTPPTGQMPLFADHLNDGSRGELDSARLLFRLHLVTQPLGFLKVLFSCCGEGMIFCTKQKSKLALDALCGPYFRS